MKILLVSPLPPPEGGIATWTIGFSEYCKVRKETLSIVNTALTGKRNANFNNKRSLIDEIKRTVYILSHMKRELQKNDVDIVHINTSCSLFGIYRDFICLKKAYRCKIPVVLHCHCNIEDQIKWKYAQLIFRRMLKMATCVFVLNSRSEAYVQKISNIECKIIPNFIKQSIIVEKHSIRKKIEEVIFVGHVQETKGVREIYQVAKRLPEVHFTLVGPVGREIQEMEGLPNVLLVGEQKAEKVFEYYQTADVSLFPSYTEGFSLSLLEAMACGLPCIATDVGANGDMLEDKGGIIVPVKNVDAIIDAFEKLEDNNIRKDISNWNIEKVKNNYTRTSVLDEIMDIYNKMVYK